MVFARMFLVYFSFLILAYTQSALALPPQVPTERFASLPSLDNVKISPDGTTLGYLISHKGQRYLQVRSFSGEKFFTVPPLDKMEISNFYWGNDNVIVIEQLAETKRFGNRATNETRLVTFNIATQESVWLGKPKKNRTLNSGRDQRPSQFEQINDLLPNDPDHILVELDFEVDGTPAVYKININSGRRQLVQGGRKGILNWYTDQNHEVRLGSGYDSHGTYYARFKNTEGKWIDLTNVDWFKYYSVADFTPNPNRLYVSGISEYGTYGLFELDLLSGEIVNTLFTNETVDYAHLLHHPITNRLIGVAYYENGLKKPFYFDPSFKSYQSVLDKTIQGSSNILVSRAKTQPYSLIFSSNSKIPGKYFLHDMQTGTFNYLGDRIDGINPKEMADVHSISIPARDNASIPSILTLPQGFTKDTEQAAVILVHGGPTSHDTAHWDDWAQFLANRGYVVLQPNFRGSDGFGYKHEQAGKNQWGGVMQDDVTDATNWLKENGYASDFCIMGASYGGYAALMGTIKEPELYQCSISINGATNLPSLNTLDQPFLGGKNWRATRNLDGDAKGVSPYHRSKEIKVPTLIIASKDDARIPYTMSKDMYKKLKKQKLKTKYVEVKNGGHSMNTEAARLTTLKAVENFLGKHLPVSD